jgi:hypothetical protein
MSASFRSFGPGPQPYRAAADTVLRLLRIFVPLAIVGAAFYVLTERPQTVTGLLRVTTDIPGAEVSIDGVRTGATTDTTLPRVPVGRRSVTVGKTGYASHPEVVFVNVIQDTVALVEFRLVSTKPALPLPAETLGIPVGLPEDTLALVEGMPLGDSLGSYPEASLLQETTEFVPVEEDTTLEHELISEEPPKLVPPRVSEIEGTSIAVLSVPEGAEIILNGDSAGHQTNYTFNDLPRGTYFITVRKKGYVPKPSSVRVDLTRSHQSELVAFEFSLDETVPPPQLTVITEPVAARIRVNGKPVGKGQIVLDANLGRFLVEFEDIVGYRTPPPQEAELTPETTSIEIVGRYERLEGKAFLALIPARAKTMQGEGLRVLVDNELLVQSPGDKFHGVLLRGLVAARRFVRVEYEGLTQEIYVDLVDDKVSIVSLTVESFFSKKNLRLRLEEPVSVKDWQKRTRRQTIIEIG